jgi:uncharacterized membrane protein YozB (DUF420 family)
VTLAELAAALPAVNAALNGTATLLLLTGFVLVKTERKVAHRNCMVAAFCVSAIFLVTYVTHKILVRGVHTPFGGEGIIAGLYYAMLISHILLAMIIVPLIFVTMAHAIKARYDRHRAWARWTYPLWLYVSITGVLVYFMLYQWFPAARQ